MLFLCDIFVALIFPIRPVETVGLVIYYSLSFAPCPSAGTKDNWNLREVVFNQQNANRKKRQHKDPDDPSHQVAKAIDG